MKRAVLWFFALAVIAALGLFAWRLADERKFASTPYGEGTRTVFIPAARARGRWRSCWPTRTWSRTRTASSPTCTGSGAMRRRRPASTQFDGALLPDEVLGKLVRGDIKLYRFTVAEGLRADEMARSWRRPAGAPARDFLAIVRDPASPKKYGVPGPSLEGYLFPDTYSLPRSAGGVDRAGDGGALPEGLAARRRQRLDSIDLDERQGGDPGQHRGEGDGHGRKRGRGSRASSTTA